MSRDDGSKLLARVNARRVSAALIWKDGTLLHIGTFDPRTRSEPAPESGIPSVRTGSSPSDLESAIRKMFA